MPFLVDTFTDTDGTLLAAHSPDLGDTWEALDFGIGTSAVGTDSVITDNALDTGAVNAQGTHHRMSTDPGDDQYDVSCTMSFRSPAQGNRFNAVSWRMTPTGTASVDVDRYTLIGDNTTNQEWRLIKVASGTETVLETVPAELVGNSFAIRVEVRDGSSEVFIDDVSTLSTSDTEITQRGRVGVCPSRGDTSDGQFIDDLSGDVVGENIEEILADVTLLAHDATVARTGNADSETVTITVAAQDATALTGGAPQPGEASLTVTAQDATVETSEDNIFALADAALVSMEAPFEPGSTTDLELVADNPIEVELDAQDATVNTSQANTTNTASLSMFASDATVVSTGEQVFAQAQEATISLVAEDSTPTGGANVSAETATITLAAENTAGQANAELASFGVAARNAQVAIDAGDIASPDAAEFTVSAFGATTTITGEFVTVGAQTATLTLEALDATVSSVIPPKVTYRFFPPTIEENLTYDDPFLQRLYWERGVSVVKKGGQFITVRFVVPESLDGQTEGVYYFVGGHHYSGIPEAIALELIDAGYEPELEVVA